MQGVWHQSTLCLQGQKDVEQQGEMIKASTKKIKESAIVSQQGKDACKLQTANKLAGQEDDNKVTSNRGEYGHMSLHEVVYIHKASHRSTIHIAHQNSKIHQQAIKAL